jgi:hypothetical protein
MQTTILWYTVCTTSTLQCTWFCPESWKCSKVSRNSPWHLAKISPDLGEILAQLQWSHMAAKLSVFALAEAVTFRAAATHHHSWTTQTPTINSWFNCLPPAPKKRILNLQTKEIETLPSKNNWNQSSWMQCNMNAPQYTKQLNLELILFNSCFQSYSYSY